MLVKFTAAERKAAVAGACGPSLHDLTPYGKSQRPTGTYILR